MPSKGVDYYFVVNDHPASLEATAFNNGSTSPDFAQTFTSSPAFQTGNTQIDWQASFSIYGSFNWSTSTTPVVAGNANINPITGNLDGGNLQDLMLTPSVLGPDFAVSYGFYDSGPGYGDLTNQDQAYAYLTPPANNWMGQLAGQYSQVSSEPFCRFALPGAHDAGTFDLTTVKALLADAEAAGAFLGLLDGFLGGSITLAASQAQTAITNLAVTQKDNILTMLNLGCRYFDFRPGYAPSQIRSFATGIYHEHTVIPGYPFQSFLSDVLSWLAANPSEIVVIGANNQGFSQPSSMTPSSSALAGILSTAQAATESTIAIGTASDLSSSYGTLLAANKRLIFLNQIDSWYPATKYDSYSPAYATVDPQAIIGALSQMSSAGQSGTDYTVLQLQGTATATGAAVVVSCALSQSHASSPLMSTKPLFDSNTYPWLLANVDSRLSNDYLVVFLNDFVDNALAQTAMAVTKQRMGLAELQ